MYEYKPIGEDRHLPISLKRYDKELNIAYNMDERLRVTIKNSDDNSTIYDSIFEYDIPTSFTKCCSGVFQMIIREIIPTKTIWDIYNKECSEYRQYAYIRSNWAGKQIFFNLFKQIKNNWDVSEEEIKTWRRIAWRNTLNKFNTTAGNIWLKSNHPEQYEYYLSDMLKYPPAVCLWLIKYLSVKDSPFSSDDRDYNELVKAVPKYLWKCKTFIDYDSNHTYTINKSGVVPQTKLQWDLLSVRPQYLMFKLLGNIKYEDVKWFKERYNYQDLTKTYNYRLLGVMINLVYDGCRIWNRYKDNEWNIPLKKPQGGVRRVIKAAAYNHNQEREINRKLIEQQPNFLLPEPPVKLPQWIEDIRLKTSHEMLLAGKECNHCIGSYTDSDDIFVRDENDCCAQIYRSRLTIVQCYDTNDRITKKSEDLEKRLTQSLQKLREEVNSSSSPLKKRRLRQ